MHFTIPHLTIRGKNPLFSLVNTPMSILKSGEKGSFGILVSGHENKKKSTAGRVN
jgi:hypothetical protein